MGIVMLQQLKPGDKIGEDVLTPLGGILFRKGKIIMERELEVMQAFLIRSVVVEGPGGSNKPHEGTVQDYTVQSPIVRSPLDDEYERMIEYLREVFNTYVPGQGMPIMDIRKQLENLLQHIKNYSILTFAPRHFSRTGLLAS